MSDSEEEKLEDYIIVEEEIGSFMTIIYREWLIPNESSFWHPGLPSDYRHMDAVRNHIIKNLKTETETDKRGKLVYNWTKIKYRSIIESSNNLRRMKVRSKYYSDVESFTEKDESTQKREPPSGKTKSAKELRAKLGTLTLPSTKKNQQPIIMTPAQEMVNDDSPPPFHKANSSTLPSSAFVSEGLQSPTVLAKESSENSIHIQAAVEEDQDSFYKEIAAHINSTENVEQLMSDMNVALVGTSKQEYTFEELKADIVAIKQKLECIPALSRSVSDMGLHIQNLSIRFDSMTREVLGNTECSKNGTDSTKNLCTTLFPVRTENEINLLNEKLRSDPQFRTDFNKYIVRVVEFNSHAKPVKRVQRLLSAIFHENVTKFANWSGRQGSNNTTLMALKDTEAFKMIIEFASSILESHKDALHTIHEWVKNTHGTRVRYHSNRKKSSTPKRKKSTQKKVLRDAPNSQSSGNPELSAVRRMLTFEEQEQGTSRPAENTDAGLSTAQRTLTYDQY